MAISKEDVRMTFECEQWDQYASLPRHLVLRYYYQDGSVETIQKKTGRPHMKRTKFSSLHRSDFFLGGTVNILGIPTRLISYADEATRLLCEESTQTTILLSESAFSSLGRCLAILTEECNFTISALQMAWVTAESVASYCLPTELGGTRAVVLRTLQTGALEKGRDFVTRITGAFAASDSQEATLWGQLCEECSQRPLGIFDEPNCSVVLIKPSAVENKQAGSILQQLIDLGLEPTGLTLVSTSNTAINELLKPYQGILPDFLGTVESLVGNVWVVQLISLDSNVDALEQVRQACGPYDSVIAKKLFPNTIRAKFGKDDTRNAVHCCDLHEDVVEYTRVFFKP